MNLVVAPYCGQNQTSHINVPATIAYKYIDREEGPWAMIPYSYLYPQPPEGTTTQGTTTQWLPPPVGKTDLWRAQGTFPL
jgi:hypothetical protein